MKKVANYLESFPEVAVAESLEQILEVPESSWLPLLLFLTYAVRWEIGSCGQGKTTSRIKQDLSSEQLEETKKVVAETGKKYWIYFSERLHVGELYLPNNRLMKVKSAALSK